MALAHEHDPASQERLARLEAELADRSEQLVGLKARWEREKAGLNRVGELMKELDELRSQAERLQREQDLAGASVILYGKIPTIEKELAEAQAEESAAEAHADDPTKPEPMVKDEVGPDDVAEVVAAWTGIPAGRLLQGESE